MSNRKYRPDDAVYWLRLKSFVWDFLYECSFGSFKLPFGENFVQFKYSFIFMSKVADHFFELNSDESRALDMNKFHRMSPDERYDLIHDPDLAFPEYWKEIEHEYHLYR